MFYKIKKFTMVLIVSNLFMSQSLMADMLFYYSAAILPSIVASNQQSDPVADAGEDKTTMVNQAVTIMGSGTDSDGIIVSYEWKKGSEVLSTDATFSYIPTAVGIDVLTLTVIDNDDNNDTDTMTVTVTDGTAPVISVTGINPLTVDQDSTYIDAGATATDDVDDTVTVTTTGSVDTSIVGEYILTYTAEDSAGNQATPKTRTVHVVDVTPPVITITGNVTPTVEHKSTYIDVGATATDNVDTNVTVTSSGSVDTNVLGDYTITYTAQDSAGNQATPKTRTVHVVDTIAPTFTSSSTALVDENQNTAITLVATDTNTVTYSISGGDAADFNVGNTSGVVTFKIAPDYESGKTSYTFTAKATDEASNVAEQSVTITIQDIVDTLPTLVDTELEIVENDEEGTVVGSVTVVDSGDSAITGFTLTGTGEGNFTIDSSGEIVVATGATLDYETAPVYHLTAVATNGFGDSLGVSVDINLTDYINPFQIAKVQANDAGISNYFGKSVSVSEDYIIIGADKGDSNGSETGSVYLFKKQATGRLVQIAKIVANDAEQNDHFGYSVSIDGDYIVVGSMRNDIGGSAYIFKRNSDSLNDVTQIAKIQSTDIESGDFFGYSVSIDGDYIAVGAYAEDTNGNSAGSVYLFKRNSDSLNDVTQIAKIQSTDIEQYDNFGSSASINGDYIAVGVPQEDTNGSSAGSVYLFKRNSDTLNDVVQIAKIQSTDIEAGDFFGNSVSINGDYIVVGAPKVGAIGDINGNDAGSVYLFKRNTDSLNDVTQIAKIQSHDIEENDFFGTSVSIDSDYIVVGSTGNDIGGSAYIFKRNSDRLNDVTQIAKIQSHDVEENDFFGNSVSISVNNIAVGAYQEDTTYSNEGSTYVFDMEPIDKPYIYNAPKFVISYDEQYFKTYVHTFVSENPSGGIIEYTLEGLDASSFIFTDNNLSFKLKADFELPEDSDVDNDYNITIVATNINSHSATENVNISVKDKSYLELAELHANDANSYSQLGNSISMSGDYIAVAAYGDSRPTGSYTGSVYLYKKQIDGSVVQIAKFQANDAQSSDYFGYSISIDGDYIIVGAYGEDTLGSSAGSAYLFRRNSDALNDVTQIAKIVASDGHQGDQFGSSVSISGDYIIIGAKLNYVTDYFDGSAYLFKRNSDDENNVTQIAKIVASDTEGSDYFGTSVSIDGNYIVVGAPKNEIGIGGSAYLFRRNSDALNDITQITKIQANHTESNDNFGSSVSINGDYIAIGANGKDKDEISVDTGSAYLFKRNSDTLNDVMQIAKIVSNDAEQYDYFGSSVSIDGDYIVVGTQLNSQGAESAYVFKRNTDGQDDITQIAKIQSTDIEQYNNFGSSVSIDGDYIVVGSSNQNSAETSTGGAYLFKRDVNQAE